MNSNVLANCYGVEPSVAYWGSGMSASCRPWVLHGRIVRLCQSSATSEIVKCFWSWVWLTKLTGLLRETHRRYIDQIVREPPSPLRIALVRLGYSVARVKIWGRSMFLAPILGGGPSRFWNFIIKLNPLSIMMQNFTTIGRQSSEISWRKKRKRKEKSKRQQNISPLQKLLFPGGLIKTAVKHKAFRNLPFGPA